MHVNLASRNALPFLLFYAIICADLRSVRASSGLSTEQGRTPMSILTLVTAIGVFAAPFAPAEAVGTTEVPTCHTTPADDPTYHPTIAIIVEAGKQRKVVAEMTPREDGIITITDRDGAIVCGITAAQWVRKQLEVVTGQPAPFTLRFNGVEVISTKG